MTLFCHGSQKYKSYVKDLPSKQTSVDLTCKATTKTFTLAKGGGEFSVESASCSRRQEPALIKTENAKCANVDYDGGKPGDAGLNLIQIGWNVTGTFHEQISACQERRHYDTLWTHHVVKGRSIELRDMSEARPSFRRDISGYKRFFTKFTSQSRLQKCDIE